MMHRKRCWSVSSVESAEKLARMLTQQTWTLCTGFFVSGHEYLFLNDATHEDGAGEFSILKGGLAAQEHVQIESITFSWCSVEKALEYIQQAITGAMDGNEFARPVHPKLETPAQHGRCHLCE